MGVKELIFWMGVGFYLAGIISFSVLAYRQHGFKGACNALLSGCGGFPILNHGLPKTGVRTWLYVVSAAVAGAGLMAMMAALTWL